MYNDSNTETQHHEEVDVLEKEVDIKKLMVWNDDVNTFDHVIRALMEICDHTSVQAEQSAYLIHTTGKHDVKRGSFEDLKPMCQGLLDRGISAEIYS